VTKGGRDRFFRNIRLELLYSLFNYKNTDNLTEI